MTELLQELCELQIENEKAVRKASFLEFDDVIKVGALFYTAKRMTPDAEKIRACKEILKRKTGFFSNFRGLLMFAIQAKMSVSPDPEAYLDAVLAIYKKLAEGRILPGEILAMAAMTIYDQSQGRDVDLVIAEVKESYARIKQKHKFLTDENDISFIALMVLSGKDVDQTLEEVETLYTALKERFRMPSDTAQSAAPDRGIHGCLSADRRRSDLHDDYDHCHFDFCQQRGELFMMNGENPDVIGKNRRISEIKRV